MDETTIQLLKKEIPEVHGALAPFPQNRKDEWLKNALKAFKQSEIDFPGDLTTQLAVSRRDANRVFRIDEPTSYDEAMKLEPWQLMKRAAEEGKLRLHTIDGKKYEFDVPAPKREEK